MAAPTDVANAALGLLGERRITDLDAAPTDSTADLLQRCYPLARDAVLARHRWSFATGWVALPLLVTAPAAQWTRQYALPQQPAALAVWALNDQDAEWEKAFDPVSGQDVIYTDLAPDVAALCTFARPDTGAWSPLAIQALVHKLAADLALAKTGQTAQYQAMLAGFEFWLGQATATDSKWQARSVPVAGTLTRRE